MLFNWIPSMAMLMIHMAIGEVVKMVIMATIVMAIGNFIMVIRGIQLKSIKKTCSFLQCKNLAYGRHRISRPMRIKAPIFFLFKKKFNPEQLLVFKALQVGQQMHQSKNLQRPMKGLTKITWEGEKRPDIATTRPNRPSGPIR